MSDEKERALLSPQVCVDPGYIDTNKMSLPKGDWKIELPVDSFYDFINKPQENKQAFEDLVKSLAEGGLMSEQPPAIIGTKEAIDKSKAYFENVSVPQPVIPSTLNEVMEKITSGLGIPMDMISTGPTTNRNGVTYNTSTNMSEAMQEAARSEMRILKEKNNNYLEVIQVQAESLKAKDIEIAKLKEALNNALNSQLDNMTGEVGQVPPPKPSMTGLLDEHGNVMFSESGKAFGIGRL